MNFRSEKEEVVQVTQRAKGTGAGSWEKRLPQFIGFFGFVAPPVSFYLFLATAVVAYLALVEMVKRLFFRYVAPRHGVHRRLTMNIFGHAPS